MRKLATVSKIQKIEELNGYDKVVLATVNNYPVIVAKNDFKKGDLCVYVSYDTVLPVEERFEFLRKRCYSKLYDGFRIKNMKMCGVFSSGIVFPLDIVEKQYQEEGKDVSKVLNIRKYDPELFIEEKKIENGDGDYNFLIKFLLKNFSVFKNIYLENKVKLSYPKTVRKSSEDNAEKVFGELHERFKKNSFYVTEKMEGQAGTWLLLKRKFRKSTYKVFSHNMYQEPNADVSWNKISKELNIEDILRAEEKINGRRLAIQGEVCGDGIPGNIYGFKKLRMFIYKIVDTDTGEAFSWEQMKEFVKVYSNLELVPELKNVKLMETVEEQLADCEGFSVFKNERTGNKIKREGYVMRTLSKAKNEKDFDSCKVKSRNYQIWFNKKNDLTI